MSLQRKTILCAVMASLWLLPACGFEPMYGANSGQATLGSPLQGNIHIMPVGSENPRFAQVLKNALEDRFNPQGKVNDHPDYTLRIDLKRQVVPSVVRSDGTILRYDVRFETLYTLTRNDEKAKKDTKYKPYTGTVRRINSYNVVPNANFATYEAEESLNERMLREIAEDYVLRMTGYVTGQ